MIKIFSLKISFIYFIFLIIPIIFLITGVYFQNAGGFRFLGSHIDPDYAYLFNSLAITQSYPVGHIDHPGTPIQILGSLVIKTTFALRNQPDMITDVLKNPEIYINLILKTFLILNSVLIFLVGIIIFKITKNLIPSILIQLTPFLSTSLISSPLMGFSPEPLLLSSGLLFLLAIFILLFSNQSRYSLSTFIFCIASGLGIAAKIIFFPLIIIPLISLPTMRYRISFILGTIVSFYIFTQPITNQYSKLFIWIKDLFIHSGRHGVGDKNIIDQTVFLSGLKYIFINQYTLIILLIVSLLIILIYILRYQISKLFNSLPFRLLIGLSITQVILILMVAKHPGGQYLIPSLLLMPATIAVLFHLTKSWYPKNFLMGKYVIQFFIILLVLFQCYSTVYKIPQIYQNLKEDQNNQLALYSEIGKYKKDIVITYFRSSSPFYALKFGNTFANFSFNNHLEAIYPNAYFWDIWNSSYSNWISNIDFQTILSNAKDKQIIFYGTSFDEYYKDYPQYKPKLPLLQLHTNNEESINKVDLSKLPTK